MYFIQFPRQYRGRAVAALIVAATLSACVGDEPTAPSVNVPTTASAVIVYTEAELLAEVRASEPNPVRQRRHDAQDRPYLGDELRQDRTDAADVWEWRRRSADVVA